MHIVEKSTRNQFVLTCPKCGALLQATGKEFEFVKPGTLACTCAACKKEIHVKERKIVTVPMYVEIKK